MIPQGIILDEQSLQDAVDYFLTQESFSFDVEASYNHKLDPNRNTLTWISLATHGSTVVIPFGHPLGEENGTTTIPAQYGGTGPRAGKWYNKTVKLYTDAPEQLDAKTVFRILSPLFSSTTIIKVAQNALYDILSVAKYLGFIPLPPYACTLVGFWLLDENKYTLGLKEMTELIYGFKYDNENTGPCVESHPFSVVAYYSFCDAKFDFLHWLSIRKKLTESNLDSVFRLEMDVLNVLIGMRIEGAPVDVEKIVSLRDTLSVELVKVEADVYRAAGRRFNINSNPQKQELLYLPKDKGGQGLRPWKLTDGGKNAKKAGKNLTIYHYSTDDSVLESFEGNTLADKLREYGDISKIINTYVGAWLGTEEKESHIVDGKIHAGFKQYGTVTGRFSCVSGNTLLPTSRGVFRFDDYVPFEDDFVVTHTGNTGRVLRKIYKGRDIMYRVSCANGSVIECTQEHRLFTPDGWKYVRDLVPGDKVYINVDLKELYSGQTEHRKSSESVLWQSGKANNISSSKTIRHDISQYSWNTEAESGTSSTEAGEPFEVFPVKAEREESDDRENRRKSSQLQRRDFRRTWLYSGKSEWQVYSASQACNGESAWLGNLADVAGRSSHRRGSAEQYLGQFSFSDQERTRETSLQTVEIREITSLGTMGVWDIEVEGDHSYVDSEGFLNHNCNKPNLQNIPRSSTELGKLVRSVFVAEPGRKLICADYSQIELVILAHYLQQGALYEGFLNDIDPHAMTAALVLGKDPADVTKDERQWYGKSINFAVVYGAGPTKVASMAHTDIKTVKKFLAKHAQQFPEIYEFKQDVIDFARTRKPVPYITTLLGRRRRMPELNSRDEGWRMGAERQTFNSLIQGGAADIMKKAMVRVDVLLPEECKIHLQVHDELVISAPEHLIDEAVVAMYEGMTGKGIQKLVKAPLKIDLHVGNNWGEVK